MHHRTSADGPVRSLPGQFCRSRGALHSAPARSAAGAVGLRPAPTRREEGSDVPTWTQAARPQEERRQPRQAPQRLRVRPPCWARRALASGGGQGGPFHYAVGRSAGSSLVTVSTVARSTRTWVPSSSKDTVVSCTL